MIQSLERLNREATLYADTLVAKIHEATELEQQYESELAAAALSYNKLLLENSRLATENEILKTLLRPVVTMPYPDEL
jgi:hypothetical protein